MTSDLLRPWRAVDAGWGHAAVEFATLSEPGNCREYVAVHDRLGIGPGDRVLDVACGAGLAIELAAVRGTTCAGIDASSRLVDVASDRNEGHDIRVGDMHTLPWADGSFDVVTSFRGIWGTTPETLAEVRRVLAPGGRLGITVWGHLKAATGGWALEPFRLAAPDKVANQAAMVALGRPGAGEAMLQRFGFVDVERVDIPFVWEFADPEAYARALMSTGPAFEAVAHVGEARFREAAIDSARRRVRAGLPLRAELPVVGYLAHAPRPTRPAVATGHLRVEPDASPVTERLFQRDLETIGFVMNVSRVWASLPDAHRQLFELLDQVARTANLTFRERGILVVAGAVRRRDSYCALAWSHKLARDSGVDLAAALLRGDDSLLTEPERALARWARCVVDDPNATTSDDVEPLRAAGYDDTQILAITVFVGLRLAFSAVNDALGIQPDHQLGGSGPISDAVDFGRAPATCR